MPRRLTREQGLLHRLFEASLLAKGVFAAVECVTGIALLVTANATIRRGIDWLTRHELVEDPTDPLASRIAALASRFDGSSQHFYAIYLLGHGLVKLVIVILLARRITAAYPLGIAVFAAFILYQLHRWTLTHSPMMLFLSAFDLLVIWLTWREWHGGLAEQG